MADNMASQMPVLSQADLNQVAAVRIPLDGLQYP